MSPSASEELKPRYVQIGEELGVAEEFLGDQTCTYIEDGKIHAAIAGKLKIDREKRKISIEAYYEKKRKIPRAGDIVTGNIYSIRRSAIGIKINTLNNLVIMDMGLVGNLHVSNVSKNYVDKLDNVFDKNDIVRAKVIRPDGNEFQISTVDNDLGVIKASCKFCGHAMVRKGKTQVVCNFCNNHQRKEMASDYGDFKELLRF